MLSISQDDDISLVDKWDQNIREYKHSYLRFLLFWDGINFLKGHGD